MSTVTSTLTQPSSALSSSVASLSASQHLPPNVARIYKQASQLFLTRRIQEAHEVLLPIITSVGGSVGNTAQEASIPIASASRGARVKVWNLYISIVNEAIALGQAAGKKEFGSVKWKELVAKARDGSVWDEVVNSGYQGSECNVDGDVIASLATLLLAHAPTQHAVQARLETWLSGSPPPLDPSSVQFDGHASGDVRGHDHDHDNVARDFTSYLRVLEIYTLHVLPANGEWDYAKEFVEMNDLLDEEQKEAFLQTLQLLEDEKNHDARREEELRKQREQQLENARRRDEEERAAKAKVEQEQQKRDEAGPRPDKAKPTEGYRQKIPAEDRIMSNSSTKSTAASRAKTSTKANAPGSPAKKSKPPPASLYKRASSAVVAIPHAILNMGQTLRSSPMAMLRTLLFMMALLLALARRDVRDRITRARDIILAKARATVGMGMKVSYI